MPRARFEVHAFDDTRRFGAALARATGAPLRRVRVHRFPDGESRVRVRAPLRASAVLVRALDVPDAKLVETLLAADALRRAGAPRVALVAPYLPYMRQDAVFEPGDAISQRVVGDLLGRGFDRVVTVEAHLHRIRRLGEVFACPALSVPAAPAIAAWLRRTVPRALVVGPDEESAPWVRAIARAARVPWRVAAKRRLGDARVQVEVPPLPGLRAPRHAVIVDDIAASGATIAATARALRRAGVLRVSVVVVHALFARGALARIGRAGVTRVVSCDTVVHPSNAIRVAPLVARALAGSSGEG
ncbi:MAG: ribose-phosphate diphosphokinase [Myxococcota bacterium]|jgi:ribose-phosphate pyrophosphokinase|nr:ribose-phosphate diphosphokinase [Myxococcota bacterium]